MSILATVFVVLVMIEHIYILILEMFLWTSPNTRKTFGTTPEFAEASRTLAANQGLYNGFLAAGLLWGLLSNQWDVKVFFSACVLVAGIYGGLTVKPRIFLVQGVPALLALVFLFLSR
ncbi:DUF1304 domain-containing protein [Deinococcus cellulosilyticus]|uniref:Membrane protein n=1 Tax=Deinococcus cellulosilyticus (strain DSM 18568 / NBRC 106333 / KACC 11606 / 5516J-15) TaxID=1223518 RepID=A0A511N0E0_DEIC1|nr:DUF1304 domain-containing protein [Deinococcus cellulosilyticus]GEM45938.1 membrane protein [Deinococcus cellulosilyticus NBRC 106333 = KACC 11606]